MSLALPMLAQPLWSPGRSLGQGLRTVLRSSHTPMEQHLSPASSRSKTPRHRWGRMWSARCYTWGLWPTTGKPWTKVREVFCGHICGHTPARWWMLCRASWPLSKEADKAENGVSREIKTVEEASKAYFIALAIVVCCSHTECFYWEPFHWFILLCSWVFVMPEMWQQGLSPQTQGASSPGRNAEGAGQL